MDEKAKQGHTPGPWEMIDDYGIGFDIDSKNHHICRLTSNNTRFEANARLIAAAPELLEACRDFVVSHTDSGGMAQEEAWQSAGAAIAKATKGE